jgi:hypothetical protein
MANLQRLDEPLSVHANQVLRVVAGLDRRDRLRTKLGFAPRLSANSAEESWETLFRSANARLSMI